MPDGAGAFTTQGGAAGAAGSAGAFSPAAGVAMSPGVGPQEAVSGGAPPTGAPPNAPRNPGVRAPLRVASMRAAMPSMACSATVRPNRASHADGSGPVFSMIPVATPRAMVTTAGSGLRISNSNVSSPSSMSSSTAHTRCTMEMSPRSNFSVGEPHSTSWFSRAVPAWQVVDSVIGPGAARFRVITNSSSSPSLARASAIDTSTPA